nr:hypothetical protein [Agromyces humatus]
MHANGAAYDRQAQPMRVARVEIRIPEDRCRRRESRTIIRHRDENTIVHPTDVDDDARARCVPVAIEQQIRDDSGQRQVGHLGMYVLRARLHPQVDDVAGCPAHRDAPRDHAGDGSCLGAVFAFGDQLGEVVQLVAECRLELAVAARPRLESREEMRALEARESIVDLVAPLGGAARAYELASLRFAAVRDPTTQERGQHDRECKSSDDDEGHIE